jgi:polysaccharide biosynthesis/export protein
VPIRLDLRGVVLLSLLLCQGPALAASAAAAPPLTTASPAAAPAPASVSAVPQALMPLGPQDAVTIHIDEDPTLGGAATIADDGTLRVPFVGAVQVGGLSPDAAARRAEQALKAGRFFVNPHVTITVTASLSQRVSVLGEVRTPGRYPVDARTSLVDLIAQAGGFTDIHADVIYVSRTDAAGNIKKFSVNMRGLNDPKNTLPEQALRGGDEVYVPRADQFFILGEVQKPAMYKLEPNMTVVQAIAVAGGITAKGSNRRVEIKRPGKNGAEQVIKAKPDDMIEPGDVIRVKESIF